MTFWEGLLAWLQRLIDQGVFADALTALENCTTGLFNAAKAAIWLITNIPN